MRKKPSADAQEKVLVESRRRCALCFGLRGDLQEKNGQIAHIDRDHSNSNIDNLCFLCLEHHDGYDTRRSQSKGFTPTELKHYRDSLYNYIHKSGLTALQGRDRSKETVFLTLHGNSVSAGQLDLQLQNAGTPFNILSFEATTPGCRVTQWNPRSLPENGLLRAPTELPRSGGTECIFQMRVRDRSGAERLFQITVNPGVSPADYDFVELS